MRVPLKGFFTREAAMSLFVHTVGRRRRLAIATAFVLLLPAAVASAAVTGTAGQLVLLDSPPADVTTGSYESDDEISIFAEQQGLELAADLAVDGTLSGVGYNRETVQADVIPTGTVVDSYFVHSDKVGGSTDPVVIEGTASFDSEVLAVIVESGSLNGSDGVLGASGTLYPTGAGRDMDGSDAVTISADRRAVSVRVRLQGATDQARVITRASRTCTDLVADGGENPTSVGEVCVANDADHLSVTYTTAGGWELTQTHLAVGSGLDEFRTKGWVTPQDAPRPGHFPYAADHVPSVDDFAYTIALDDLGVSPGDTLSIAAHADVELRRELVGNGGFEAPVVTRPAGWELFGSGHPGLDWAVSWTHAPELGPDPAPLELLRAGIGIIPAGWASFEGSQYTELDSHRPGVTANQASVVISQELDPARFDACALGYAWSPRPGHDDNALEVRFGGEVVGTHAADGTGLTQTTWTAEELGAQITGGPATLEFEETGAGDSFGMFLDAVSLGCVRSEGAWGEGTRFVESNWAMLFGYEVR